MADAPRDQNYVPVLMGVSSADGVTPLAVKINPATGRIVVDSTGTGMGDVSGPASSTDGAIARYAGTSGKVIENSSVTLDDNGNLNNVNGVQFDTTPVADSFSPGKTRWNAAAGTIETDTDIPGVTIQHGQELQKKAYNKSGTTILNGKLVYFSGEHGNEPKMYLASNTDLVNGENVVGMVTADCSDNALGAVTQFGKVRDLNTSGFTAGDSLWLDTNGNFTNVEPSGGVLTIKIGRVDVSHPTQGEVSIHVENPMSAQVLKNMGVVTQEWTGFEDNDNISVAGDSAARTVTLTRTGGLTYYISGKRFTQSSPYVTPAHGADTAQVYFCTFDSSGVFSWSTTPFDFKTQGMVAIARYNAAESAWIYTREVHGLTMDWRTHETIHNTIGTWLKSGGGLTSATYSVQPASPANADNTPGVDSAVIVDEDLNSTINAWIQGTYTTLRFVSSVATYDNAATLPFRVTGTYPNINTGGTTETETATGRYFNVYAVLVPMTSEAASQKYRVLWVQPQTAYLTTASAQAEQFASLNLGNLGTAFQEYVPVRRITFETNASWTGATGRCRIDAVTVPGTTRAASAVSSLDPSKLPLAGGSMFGAINEAKGSDIASATTTDIGAATGNFVDVTGTTTITGLGTVQAGTRRVVRFADALLLTHNATSLILPTGANITTAAGDTATFLSLGSGNWVCTQYQRKDGTALASSGGAGGLTRDLWYSLTGSYASASTFTTTEASSAEATRLAGLAERSLFTCTDSAGTTRRIGYVKSASASSTDITYVVVTNSDLASGDKNFRITPNRKVEDYAHRISIPGEMIADASNPQGVWLLNLKAASYLLPVNSAVRTAAAGSGAACAWNVYAGASNLFSAAQDMTTSATFDEKRPTTNTMAVGDNISLRITSSAGATNKAQDFQAELFIVPQTLYTSQA